MIEGLITGTLVGLAEQRQGKNDTSFVLAKVKSTPGEGESLIFHVTARAARPVLDLVASQVLLSTTWTASAPPRATPT